jgi:uncharacterized RDD family membrane protein YckC
MTMTAAFCMECGTEIPAVAKYCPVCGTGTAAPITASNGSSDLPLATFGQRVGALLIDAVVTTAIMAFGFFVTAVVATATPADQSGPGGLLALYNALVFLLVFTYKPMFEGASGQTLGKKAMGICVVSAEDGSLIGYGRAFGRSLACLLDFGVGLLLPLWDANRQTIHDKAAGTIVIQDR